MTTITDAVSQMESRRRFAARLAVCAIALIVLVAAGILVTGSSEWTRSESEILQAFSLAHTPFLTWIALAINVLFSPPIAAAIVVIVTIAVLFRTRRLGDALEFAAVVTGSWFGSEIVKWIVHRPRPDQSLLAHPLVIETSFSYPSGHTAFAASLGLGLILLVRRSRWRPVLFGVVAVVSVLVALSRMYLGVHYPTDVAASLIYSIAMMTVLASIWSRFVTPRRAQDNST